MSRNAAPLLESTSVRLREFAFSEEDFQALRALVKSLTGIHLTEQKRELVYGRLTRRLRALRLRSFADYRDLLRRDGGPPELPTLDAGGVVAPNALPTPAALEALSCSGCGSANASG